MLGLSGLGTAIPAIVEHSEVGWQWDVTSACCRRSSTRGLVCETQMAPPRNSSVNKSPRKCDAPWILLVGPEPLYRKPRRARILRGRRRERGSPQAAPDVS